MTFIDSSRTSALKDALARSQEDEPLEELERQEESDQDTPDEPLRDEDLSPKDNLLQFIDNINLARDLDQSTLDKLGGLVVEEFDIDDNSRSDWKDKAEKAMKFAVQEIQQKQYPWPGASSVIFPLMTQSAIQFAARAYPAIVQNRSVVKGVVWGSDKGTPATINGKPDGSPKIGPDGQPVWLSKPGEKRQRADRVAEHMSWQLLDEMPEWEPQTDQLLHQIPIIGGAIRKTYRDPTQRRNFSLFVSLMNIVWNYHSPSFEAAPRHTEILTVYPHEIIENERTDEDENGEGKWLHLDYGPGDTDERIGGFEENREGGDQADESSPHIFLEQHRRYDLDGDGYAEPYVVTVHKRSGKVVRIVARYDEESIEETDGKDPEILRVTPVEHYTLIPFLPSIDGGAYPMGFGHILRPLNEAINTTLNQMFDAGHLQNAGGGFISDQLGVPSGTVNFQVGKYVRVAGTKGMSIREAVFPLPFAGPSTVLFQLLGVLMQAGKEVASIQDILAGDVAKADASPTTVLALIEQGMKVYTAIHKRIYRALKSEFAKIYRLNRLYLNENQRYRIGDEWREVTPEDYRLGGGVEPIADETMLTDMQKLSRAQILMLFKDDPLVNQLEIRQRFFEAANINRIEELLVPPQQPSPMAQQMAAQTAQIALEMAIAELGKARSEEQKNQTQAYLNLAQARKLSSAPEEALIEAQLDMLRLHIEAVNSTIKAADIEYRSKDKAKIGGVEKDAERDAGDRIALPRPALTGGQGAGVPIVAPQSANGGVPQVPGGPGQ